MWKEYLSKSFLLQIKVRVGGGGANWQIENTINYNYRLII